MKNKEQFNLDNCLQIALNAHQSGQLEQAELHYQTILKEEPQHFDALQLMGVIAGQKKDYPKALNYLGQAIKINPEHQDCHFNLAKIHLELNQYQQALEALKSALELPPEEPSILYLAGQVSLRLEMEEQAIDYFKRTLALEANVQAMNDLGVCLQNREQYNEAIEYFEKAITLKPDFIEAYNNLGNALQQIQQWELALQVYQNAILIHPEFIGTYNNLGSLFLALGQLNRALEFYQLALQKTPTNLEALLGLSRCCIQSKKAELAIPSLLMARNLYPEEKQVKNLLIEAEIIQGHFQQVVDYCQDILKQEPESVQTLLQLGKAKLLQGEILESLDVTKRAAMLDVDSCNDYLWTLLHDPHSQNHELFQAYRHWGAKLESKYYPTYFDYLQPTEEMKVLRIGFLSQDFKQHSAQYFYPALMKELDREQFKVICYSDVLVEDHVTEKFKQMADEWYAIRTLSNQQLAELIFNHKIDILIEPGSGSTSYRRVEVFNRKPAPIQLSFFPMTSGLKSLDYLIGDRHIEVIGQERYHTEKVIKLPDCLLCYSPPEQTPDIAELPVKINDYITFGSFNRPSKLNEEVIKTWSQILLQVPNSRLVLKGDFQEAHTCESLVRRFESYQISADRIELLPHMPDPDKHFDLYNQLDITLDPFPFGGHTTSYESFWMGVPVITLKQNRFFSRQALAVLKNLALEDLIAEDKEDYIEVAVSLANNRQYLEELRHSLRETMSQSPLCDLAGYAHHIEAILRQIWRNYCFKNPSP